MLKELMAGDVKEPQVSTEWRASEVGECETFLCHVKLGHPALPFTGRVHHMLDDGLMHERDIIDRIRSKGFKVLHSYAEGQLPVCCYDKDGITIMGHPDGILDKVYTRDFELDYVDERFDWTCRYHLLEVTAPNHFTFLRLERNHLRSELWRKFVQIHMYLNSEELQAYGNSCVTVIKNKNTSALYEEGIGLDRQIVTDIIEKLKKVEDYVSKGQTSPFRCEDWRRHYCRYRDLCYGESIGVTPVSGQILEGESLSEAEQLLEAAQLWLKGKGLEDDAKELIEDARALFSDTIAEYGAKGLTIGPAKALIVEPTTPRQSISFDLLKQKYPEVYEALVTEEIPNPYLRVSRR